MLKIGDFSRLARISIRMLRYYDEHDILKPSYIDMNGYRYYDTMQIYTAYQINAMRMMDFSSAMIKNVLENFHDKDEVGKLMRFQRELLMKEQKDLQKKISFMNHAIQVMDKEAMNMKYEVEVKTIDKKFMMCTRGVIPSYEKEGLLWERLCKEPQALGMQIDYPKQPQSRAYFYNEGYKEKEPEVEVCLEVVERQYEDSDHIKFYWKPACKVASVTFKGAYEQSLEVSLVLATWINEQGYALDGPDFSIYHVGYNDTNNPAEFITEICFPIKQPYQM